MHPLMTQTITHYPVVSEHNFVLSVIPVFIMKKEKKKYKIGFPGLDNMEGRQMEFNHRF